MLGSRRKRPHLIGNHCKAAPGFARACRFDGGVEREQIGLIGDAGNHRENRLNVLAEQGQLIDGTAGSVHFLCQTQNCIGRARNQGNAVGGLLISGQRCLSRRVRIAGNLFSSGSHLLHGRGQLLQFLQLRLHAVGRLAGLHRCHRRAFTHVLGTAHHIANERSEVLQEPVELRRNQRYFIVAGNRQLTGQVALPVIDVYQRVFQAVQWTQQHFHPEPEEQ
ncbi:hypothetical protein D9M71_576250 [compost metagenome]